MIKTKTCAAQSVEPKRACVLMLSNSIRATGIFKSAIEVVMWDMALPWQWESYIPSP